jgi:hypothetical protein
MTKTREERRLQFHAMLRDAWPDYTNVQHHQNAADLLHSSTDRIRSWLKPETAKGSNPVPLWAIELLTYKIADMRSRKPKAKGRHCAYCGETHKPEAETWQQWQCSACSSWNDKDPE